jgi:O-methyltransferase
VNNLIRFVKTWRYWDACIKFLGMQNLGIPFVQRYRLLKDLYKITFAFDDIPHYQRQILDFVIAVLQAPRDIPGVIIEAGCFRGVSSAKFSLAARLAGKQLVVLDSFQGIPPNSEQHEIYGRVVSFAEGDYAGSLDEVVRNISAYGDIASCRFVEGWFDDTLPHFNEPVAAVYLDVDLVSSTKTCLKYLWPLLNPGGVIFSQDGHLTRIQELFKDQQFWRDEVGCAPPRVDYLPKTHLLAVHKPA